MPLISGCLPVGSGSLFEVWPLNSAILVCVSVIYSSHIVEKLTIIPPPNPSWACFATFFRKFMGYWLQDVFPVRYKAAFFSNIPKTAAILDFLSVIARCRVACGKFRQLYPILTSRHMTLATCGRLYNAYVYSIMIYKTETWDWET